MIRLLIFVVSFGVYLQVVWAEGLPFNDHNERNLVHCDAEQGVRGVVSNTLQSCTGDNASWQNFARTWAANTIGQWGSGEIGDLVNISPAAKTFFHGFVGGTSGGLMGGTGCVAAGIAGGIVGETLCHKMIQSGVSPEEAAKIARMMSTIAGIPIGGNPVVAHATATNTVTHNSLKHLVIKKAAEIIIKAAKNATKVEGQHLRAALREVEKETGRKITTQQKKELIDYCLKNRNFEKLAKAEKIAHTKLFNKSGVRDKLIDAWEKMGGTNKVREWPKYNKINLRTGENELYKYQAHHIIPQQVKGPHVWWNMHPAHPSVHQSVLHGSGSRLQEILRTLPQGVK